MALADEVARRVAETVTARNSFLPTPFEREKIVHDAVAAVPGAQRKRRRGARTPSRCAPRIQLRGFGGRPDRRRSKRSAERLGQSRERRMFHET